MLCIVFVVCMLIGVVIGLFVSELLMERVERWWFGKPRA